MIEVGLYFALSPWVVNENVLWFSIGQPVLQAPNMIFLSVAMSTVYSHDSTAPHSDLFPAFMDNHPPAQFLRADLYLPMVNMSHMDKTRPDLHSETTNSHVASVTL